MQVPRQRRQVQKGRPRLSGLAGRRLSLDRIMAWHVRQALGDVLWRSEAGLPLPDHRTPAGWVTDLEARFRAITA